MKQSYGVGRINQKATRAFGSITGTTAANGSNRIGTPAPRPGTAPGPSAGWRRTERRIIGAGTGARPAPIASQMGATAGRSRCRYRNCQKPGPEREVWNDDVHLAMVGSRGDRALHGRDGSCGSPVRAPADFYRGLLRRETFDPTLGDGYFHLR